LVNSRYFLNAMALLLLFCCSITSAVRRWLKTQAAAEMGAANEAIHLWWRRAADKTELEKIATKICIDVILYDANQDCNQRLRV
jgi:hypothetical protein